MSWPQSSFLNSKFIHLCAHATVRLECLKGCLFNVSWTELLFLITHLPSVVLLNSSLLLVTRSSLSSQAKKFLIAFSPKSLRKYCCIHICCLYTICTFFDTSPVTAWLKPPSYFTWSLTCPHISALALLKSGVSSKVLVSRVLLFLCSNSSHLPPGSFREVRSF